MKYKIQLNEDSIRFGIFVFICTTHVCIKNGIYPHSSIKFQQGISKSLPSLDILRFLNNNNKVSLISNLKGHHLE